MNNTSTVMINYNTFSKQLEPFCDTIFYVPLSEDEVTEIESIMEHQLPSYFREFLLRYGLRQDFFSGLAENTQEMLAAWEALPDGFKKDYVLIGNNGGEEYWLANAHNDNDLIIYEWQYWDSSDVIPTTFTFADLLQQCLDDLKEHSAERIPNTEKVWGVSMSIETNEEANILTVLDAEQVVGWSEPDTSTENVTTSESEVQIKGYRMRFIKQEHPDWETASFYIKIYRPVLHSSSDDIIQEIRKRLQDSFGRNFSMGDMGLLRIRPDMIF